MSTATSREQLIRSRLIDRIERVELRVTDVERALDFYRDIAGFTVSDEDGGRAVLGDGSGQGFLVLDPTGVSKPADPRATGLFHTAFRFPSRAALGDALARVVHARLEVGAGDHLVSEALYVDDPDGNGVELYWDRPTDQWPPPTEDMLVPMATLAVDLENLYDEGRGREALGQGAPERTDVGHVHLQVSDIDRSARFYAEVLGLDATARLGSSASFFSSKGYHHNIGANTWRSRGGNPASKEHAGLERVVFGVTDQDEMEALRGRLDGAGHGYTESDRGLSVVDPDGIELVFALAS